MASFKFRDFVTGLSIWALATFIMTTGCDGIDAVGAVNRASPVNALQPDANDLNSQDNATTPENGNSGNDESRQNEGAATIDAVTTAIADRLFTFGHSSFFSSGSITENNDLELCGFGRFGLRITRITSTSFDTFSSENILVGTWSIEAAGSDLTLVLVVDDASDPADIGTRRIALSSDANGDILFDGERADIADATADCAAAQ